MNTHCFIKFWCVCERKLDVLACSGYWRTSARNFFRYHFSSEHHLSASITRELQVGYFIDIQLIMFSDDIYRTFTNDRVNFEQAFLKSKPEFMLHPFQNTPPNELHVSCRPYRILFFLGQNTRIFQKYDVYTTEYGSINEIWIETSEILKIFIANSFQEVETLSENENVSIPIWLPLVLLACLRQEGSWNSISM